MDDNIHNLRDALAQERKKGAAMANKRETIADIRWEAESEFRDLLGRCSVIISHMQIMQKFNRFFDRIEAAARRERKHKRNCDRFNTGDLKRDAQDAMEAMLDEGVAGFRSMAEYLLSPVCTERKGEGDGSK